MVAHLPALVPLVLTSAQHAAANQPDASTSSDAAATDDAMSVDGEADQQGGAEEAPAVLELVAVLGALLALLERMGAFLAPYLPKVRYCHNNGVECVTVSSIAG